MKGVADIVAIAQLRMGGYMYDLTKPMPINFAWGRIVCIEVKSAKGKLSPDQEAFKQNIEANGGIYILARSVEDVQKVWSE